MWLTLPQQTMVRFEDAGGNAASVFATILMVKQKVRSFSPHEETNLHTENNNKIIARFP